ncbi:cytochrome P450, partial [Erythrobacter sp. YJ-T3-07]|uniref:cytochrome P450 n=1 Tax=Erythrobacter sp. YJ-T3-07 TaxID=2793063 RepID=UPI0018D34D53|nr:cytochrome P450 [Erythrobacter sp. YJ-T3-07]
AASLTFPATFEQIKDLAYLDAVLREGIRIHTILSGILERIVPEGGLILRDGRHTEAGTIVGMNP